MNFLTIGEVARMANVQTSAIRYYERIGLLPRPPRANGQRRYDDSILRKLGLIQMAREAGMGIADIHALLHEFPDGTPPSERWQVLATAKIAEMDALIQRAQAMKALLEETLACACPTLDDCGEVAWAQGREETITEQQRDSQVGDGSGDIRPHSHRETEVFG